MPKRQRPQIRGQGADVFLAGSEHDEEVNRSDGRPSAADTRKVKEKRVMTTVYLPPELVDLLDEVWLERRKQDRKVQKSHLVAAALEAYLKP